ncbi:flagellar biosynthetic protein FliP [Paracoccus suum]|uniref:Flagellar biosynthetic protein FliP n=1 Tax=Paracoccus suum TaxID=2259340 RepID=A0A344PI34_9RHOB|nr:flagellar type III secretion system pore protein FliP [Paracoccus suum]AXC49039.1 flagellar biosynthetic protein FliP [Paracoccus suum]
MRHRLLLAAGAVMLAAALALPIPALAQAIGPNLPVPPAGAGDLADGLGGLAGGVGRNAAFLVLAMTALSLAPGLAIAVTCFPFIVTVLSILRQSIGLPQSPPNMLIVVLSIFLTWFVMDPVLREAWRVAGQPLQAGQINLSEAFDRGIVPFRAFMEARTDPDTLAALAEVAPGRMDAAAATPGSSAAEADVAREAALGDPAAAALSVLVPSFMLSEVQRAFEVGFLIALPFLVIDLVVSAVLMSMGMMMVPPAVVALPFKLAFFVVVDGWGMVAGALVRSYQ